MKKKNWAWSHYIMIIAGVTTCLTFVAHSAPHAINRIMKPTSVPLTRIHRHLSAPLSKPNISHTFFAKHFLTFVHYARYTSNRKASKK